MARCSAESASGEEVSEEETLPSAKTLFSEALRNRTYRLLLAGFSTCGFHMVIIESHLFSQFVSYGIAKNAASWSFSIYGIATIAGALLSGFLSGRLKKGNFLGFYYGFRAVFVFCYLFLLPKNLATAFLFSIGLGMTGDATVSPTSGLVSEHFSLVRIASLVGLLFLCHQVGAFFSAWLGGVLLKATGGYTAVWSIDIVLCTAACLFSLMIERKPNRKTGSGEEALRQV
ncbi:MAG: MFS transporter [Eubacteriales bacterium]|nr:MFS transporter [Eubacteriales bacterium]